MKPVLRVLAAALWLTPWTATRAAEATPDLTILGPDYPRVFFFARLNRVLRARG